MSILSLLCGAVVGFSLGLTGGGGSIFAVPLLYYIIGLSFRSSVVVSLGVVGMTALYGTLLQARRGQVVWGAGTVLGVGGIIASGFGSRLGSYLSEDLSLLLFASLMIIIGASMIRGPDTSSDVPLSWIACKDSSHEAIRFSLPCACKLLVAGGITGILSGIFGVGGGFLLVPALLLVPRLPVHKASGTSLVAIAIISVAALVYNARTVAEIPLVTSSFFLVGALVGMTSGSYMKARLPNRTLRLTFGLMVIMTALFIYLRVLA